MQVSVVKRFHDMAIAVFLPTRVLVLRSSINDYTVYTVTLTETLVARFGYMIAGEQVGNMSFIHTER